MTPAGQQMQGPTSLCTTTIQGQKSKGLPKRVYVAKGTNTRHEAQHTPAPQESTRMPPRSSQNISCCPHSLEGSTLTIMSIHKTCVPSHLTQHDPPLKLTQTHTYHEHFGVQTHTQLGFMCTNPHTTWLQPQDSSYGHSRGWTLYQKSRAHQPRWYFPSVQVEAALLLHTEEPPFRDDLEPS